MVLIKYYKSKGVSSVMSFMLFKMTWHAVYYQIFEINSSKISFQKENFTSQTPHHQFMKN